MHWCTHWRVGSRREDQNVVLAELEGRKLAAKESVSEYVSDVKQLVRKVNIMF